MPRKAPTSPHAADQLLFRQVRNAWKKGQTTMKVEYEGREIEMRLRKVAKKVSYTLGDPGPKAKGPIAPTHYTREETWLVATAKDGRGPILSVEPKPGCNSRIMAAVL